VNVRVDAGEVGSVAVAVADAYVPSREVIAQQRGRPARKTESHADAASLRKNEDSAYVVETLDLDSTSTRALPPELKENEPEPPESAESDSSRSRCATSNSSGSDVYLTGSEGESMDIELTNVENSRDVGNPLVNTRSAFNPNPEAAATAMFGLGDLNEV
jgi:hypothetical protein